MKRTIFLCISLCANIILYAQHVQHCNRTTFIKSYEDRLPTNICFPEKYMLRAILSDTVDIDSDEKADFAVKLEKINAVDGDTSLVVIYRQIEHGHFEQWFVFDNLFPVFFKDYWYEYAAEYEDNSSLAKLKRRYQSPEYSNILFKADTIIVKFNTSGGEGLLLYFALNKKTGSWSLKKQSNWYGLKSSIEKILYSDTTNNQYDIRKFNMLDYLDE